MEGCLSESADDCTKSKNNNFPDLSETKSSTNSHNVMAKGELHDIFSENNTDKEAENTFMNDNGVLSDDFLVDLLQRNSTHTADSSQFGNTSEKVQQVKTDCEVKMSTEGDKNISDEKEVIATNALKHNGEDNPILIETDSYRAHELNGNTMKDVSVVEVESCGSSEKGIIVANGLEHSEAINSVLTESNFPHEHELSGNAIKDASFAEIEKCNPAVQLAKTAYRCDSDSWSDDDDSDSSSDTSSDSDFFQMMVQSSVPKKIPIVKTKGELGLDDLPPIEELCISVNEEEMTAIGKVHAVVEKLVVIHAIKDMKPLDLDSVLFLSHDKPLGRIFDVFGPVVEPFYCVRFNTKEHIMEKGVEIGTDVFFAPEKNDITSYVFVDELQKQKGSDASWKHNNEPPEEFLDFSDDEEEKVAKRKRMLKNRNRHFFNNSDAMSKRPTLEGDSPSQSNYRPFVQPVSPRNNNIQIHSIRFPRHNPFAAPPLPPPSPSPSVCSIMSAPVRIQNSFNASSPSQPQLPFSHPQRSFSPQNLLQRPSSPLLFAPYQQPHVFGQMTLLSPLPSPLHSPSPFHSSFMGNIPTLISPSHLSSTTPQNCFRFPRSPLPVSQTRFTSGNSNNYINQNFPRNQSPVSQGHRILPEPWLPNRSPESFRVPPNHPLTVQIPNQNSPSITIHPFQTGNAPPLQPFINNVNFCGDNMQSRFQ